MRNVLLAILLLTAFKTTAQRFSDTAIVLNKARINTDVKGMKVLAGWGAFNTVAGVSDYLLSDREESKRFYQMGAAFGVINLSIATLSYYSAQRESGRQYSCNRALNRYESTRRIYLLNAGLDGLYISTGLYLKARSRSTATHTEMQRGYGNALILQGAGLLLFDVSMYTVHSRSGKGWYKALAGICFTGDGIGLRYAL